MDVVQIVQNHEQPLTRIAPPQSNERFRDFLDALSAAEHSIQAIGMYIVEAEKLLGALQATVGRTNAMQLLCRAPRPCRPWVSVPAVPFVETDYRGVRCVGEAPQRGGFQNPDPLLQQQGFTTGNLNAYIVEMRVVGGRGGTRTRGPLLAKQVLSQLSYTPTITT